MNTNIFSRATETILSILLLSPHAYCMCELSVMPSFNKKMIDIWDVVLSDKPHPALNEPLQGVRIPLLSKFPGKLFDALDHFQIRLPKHHVWSFA